MNPIFDTHAHYLSSRYDGHLDEILQYIKDENVGAVLECGTDYSSSKKAIELAEKEELFYAALGIHPQSLIEEDASTLSIFKGDWKAEIAAIKPLYENKKVVAVGEIGLDYHWPIPKEPQQQMFVEFLSLAHELNLPVSMHDREAHGDMYERLKKYKPKGIMHAYSGSAEDAKWLTKQGIMLGIGGTVTFKNARQVVETVQEIDIEHIILETDCPYLAPVPKRGSENNSANIIYVAQRIAEIKQVSTEEVLKITWQNANRLFDIK